MDTIFFDDCLQNLFYAEETMKEWISISDYEIIFEAVDPNVQNKILKNEATGEKSVGFIQKAIDAVIKLIQKILSPLKNFIDRFTMSTEEREAYERFKQEVANDPKLRNRKVSVSDFRNITAQYDKLISEVDREIKAVETDPNRPIDDITKKISDFLNGTVPAATAIVGIDMATKIADSNIEMAKSIQTLLNTEKSIMTNLSQQLGKGRANKFKKDIDAAAKNTKLHRFKVALCRKKYDSLQDCIKGTFSAFKQISPKHFSLYADLLSNKQTRSAAGEIIKAGGKIGVEALKGDIELNKIEKDINKSKKKFEKEDRESEKRQEAKRKAAAKEAKERAKHADDPKYKSKTDFITGK